MNPFDPGELPEHPGPTTKEHLAITQRDLAEARAEIARLKTGITAAVCDECKGRGYKGKYGEAQTECNNCDCSGFDGGYGGKAEQLLLLAQ